MPIKSIRTFVILFLVIKPTHVFHEERGYGLERELGQGGPFWQEWRKTRVKADKHTWKDDPCKKKQVHCHFYNFSVGKDGKRI